MNGVYYSCIETIEKISDMIDSDTPGGYFRFGDGDMNLALGLSEMLQQSNPQLQVYMSNALKEKDKNILKGLTLHNKEWETLEDGVRSCTINLNYLLMMIIQRYIRVLLCLILQHKIQFIPLIFSKK